MNKIRQDMIIFRQCGELPNGKKFMFDNEEILSTDKVIALRELNKLGIRVLQMGIRPNQGMEWWLVEELL